MTRRYALTHDPDAIRRHFGLAAVDPFPARDAIVPGQPVLTVRESTRGGREAALMLWGLMPSWVKDPRDWKPLATARSETAADKPSFRAALRHRRCLVPATGYYGGGRPREARRSHLISPADAAPIAIAGLWEHWIGADGSEVETVALLTGPSRPEVAPDDDRMPILIAPATFDRWLDCRSGSASGIGDLLAGPGREGGLDGGA